MKKDDLLGCAVLPILCAVACALVHWIRWLWLFAISMGQYAYEPVELRGMWLLTWVGNVILVAALPVGVILAAIEELRKKPSLRRLVVSLPLLAIILWPFWLGERRLWSTRQRITQSRDITPTFGEVYEALRKWQFTHFQPSTNSVQPYIIGPTIVILGHERKEYVNGPIKIFFGGSQDHRYVTRYRVIKPFAFPYVQATSCAELKTLVVVHLDRYDKITGSIRDWPSRKIIASTDSFRPVSVDVEGNVTPGQIYAPGFSWSIPRWRTFIRHMNTLVATQGVTNQQ